MPLNDKQKKVVAVVGAGVVLGGAALYLATRKGGKKEAASDDLFKPTEASKAAAKAAAPTPAPAAAKAAAPAPKAEATKAAVVAAPAAAATAAKKVAAAPVVFSDRPHAQNFPEFFCSVIPPDGWECSSDPAPMPNIGMIMFKKPEFEDMPEAEIPGALPAVILTIEDVSVENLTVIELKEKSKQMAFQQIMQMSGGQCRPQVIADQREQNGVFEYTLEYNQSIPPYMNMRVSNLITIKNGLAYCFQLVAIPEVFAQYKAAFIAMAKSVEIIEEAAGKTFVDGPHMANVINGISIKVPTPWSYLTSTAAGDRLVEFKNGSETKTEMITVFKGAAVGLDSFTEASKAEVDGVTVVTMKDNGSKTRKVATHNGYAVVVSPLKMSKSLIDDATIAAVVKSIAPSDAVNARRFVNTTDSYEVPVAPKGSIVCSKIGCGTVIYAPAGMEAMQSGEEAPTCTLRVGNPSNDKSCASSLDEWRERLGSEEGVGEISNTTLAGLDAITFTTTEMSEVGPGMRQEVKSKVVIAIVANGDTVLIRWECPSGPYRRYESQLNSLLSEIIIF